AVRRVRGPRYAAFRRGGDEIPARPSRAETALGDRQPVPRPSEAIRGRPRFVRNRPAILALDPHLNGDTTAMEGNPFAVLSLIVAPAILTNASSVLVMSTSNRLARAVDRGRELSKQLEAGNEFTSPEARRRLSELTASETRALLLL